MFKIAYINIRLLKWKEAEVLVISRDIFEEKIGSGGWI